VRPCHRPQKEEGKGPENGLFSKNRACKLAQLPKPSRNKPTSKLLCKLDITCSWFSNNKLLEAILIVKPIPSSHNLYIRTFSQLHVMHNEEHKNFYFQINTQKVLVEALTTVHKNQRFFHTCYHVWKHESMGYRIKLRGPLILVVLRVWSSIILLCRILDVCILPFITSFAQRWNQNLLSKVLCEYL
jgi:hypothetical protein